MEPILNFVREQVFQTNRVENLANGLPPDFSNPTLFGLPENTENLKINVGDGHVASWLMFSAKYNERDIHRKRSLLFEDSTFFDLIV